MTQTTFPLNIIEVFNEPKLGFKGNTAAVIQLQTPLKEQQMQSIASDLNQPATTFLWPANDNQTWNIRWYAPDAEIGLCGHGSLAAFAHLGAELILRLNYREGEITGQKESSDSCSMSLAPIFSEKADIPTIVKNGLGQHIIGYYTNNNKHIVLLENEEAVRSMKPNFSKLRESNTFGYTVTAPGDQTDFVSRTIVPHVQQLEDHATGSSHAALTPFWAERLNKNKLSAYQLSQRGGSFLCEYIDNKVKLHGKFKVIVKGTINL